MADPDEPLVRRAQRGDRWAFEQLVERHQHRLFTLAARVLGSPDDAADAVQETFLRAWLSLPKFRAGSLFSTWLFRICLNAAYDQRSRRRPDPAEVDTTVSDPRDPFLARELSGALQQALNGLDEPYRVAVVLYDVLGCSYSEIAELTGVRHAVALSSGTAALHLALLVAGVEPGDEVLVSTLTFVASANAVFHAGARPCFIDSDPTSWNMDPGLLAEELNERSRVGRLPRAVVVVDLYGQCADYGPILEACRRYDVVVIEDAAEAVGATYRGRPAGGLGDIGVLSFNGNKIITTSGGGMLITDRDDWAVRARHLATQAREPALHYEHAEVGFNYRLSNLLAAVGRAQLRGLDEKVERRRSIFDYYRDALGVMPGVTFMPEAEYGRANRWLTVALLDAGRFGASPAEVVALLEAHDIEARPAWKPMHRQPAFADLPVRGGAVAEGIFDSGLCLPSGSSMTDGDLDRVADMVLSCAASTSGQGLQE